MIQTCKTCKKQFELTDQDLAIIQKINVPFPDTCPIDRHIQKMAFRNERILYKRKCALCEKDIITMYQEDSPYTVYCSSCWWSDKWDPTTYARDFNFNRPFFDQFDELFTKVPKNTLDNFDFENAEYCNFSSHQKNCYMIFGSWYNENCMYSNTLISSFDVSDALYTNKCKHSYELIDCENSYELFFAQNCDACSNSYFLFDCKNCQNCAFCWNLRNKSYQLFNKPVAKEEFDKTIEELLSSPGKLKEAREKFANLVQNKAIHKFMDGEKNENSDGNFLQGCKNVHDLFYSKETEDITHSLRSVEHQKDSMFIYGNSGGELMYDSLHCDYCHNGKFSLGCEHVTDFFYSINCYQCNNIFGCTGLRHKKYAILNKEYSQKDYETLLKKILEHIKGTGEWGHFFPTKISPFKYEETIISEFFKEEGDKLFLPSKESTKNFSETPPAQVKTPSSSPKSPDILICFICNKLFKLIKEEQNFYKKYLLPTPGYCFGCRHLKRMQIRAPYRLFSRTCSNCGKSLKSSYSPDRKEKVYCEECYLKAVY